MPLERGSSRDRPPSADAERPSLLACILGVGGFLAVSALSLYAVAWLGR